MRLPLLLLLFLTTALPAQEPADTHVYQPGIDVLHYSLHVDLPETGGEIGGRALLTVHRTAPVDTLVLDLIALRVDSVLVEDVATGFRRGPSTIHVPLPPGSGDTLWVEVGYGGEPRDGLIVRTDERGRWTGFGDNWPDRARHWIPSVDHPSDKATVAWTITAPEGRGVVANGRKVEDRPEGEGRRLTRWVTSRPIPVYLMVIGAGPLVEHPLGESACGMAELAGCVPQSVYASPDSRDFLPGPFAEADEILEFFASRFAPYPYEKLDHVQSSTRFGGMENATAIFYSDVAFRERTLGTPLIAHETAHQWFGNTVTPREWSHLWLSEGFATYLTELWREHSEGPAALREGMSVIRDEILASPTVRERPVIDEAQTEYMELLNANSYDKGGFVLHMLRSVVGDSAFLRGLRHYYAANRHGTALTDDLVRAVEAASGQELGWFFDQWLRRPGYPELATAWRHDPAGRQLLLEVMQGETFGAYRFPLEVEVVDASGDRHRTAVEIDDAASQQVVLPLELDAAPREVRLDPEVRLLARFRAAAPFPVEEATIAGIHAEMRAGRLTARELVERSLERIEVYDRRGPHLNSLITLHPRALAIADSLDALLARTGRPAGPLHGIPVIVKDNYDTFDLPTTAGSLSLAGSVPPDDAFQVRRIREAGGIVLAKSNMAEFAFTPHETVGSMLPGYTRNPYDPTRVTAGSSGGTAAAVAASFGTVGLGTDTGNSIRGPAAHQALVGIRSTMGLTSRDGIIPLYLDRDVGGPMARTVADAVAVLDVIAGPDPADPVTESSRGRIPEGGYSAFLREDGLRGKRLGVVRQLSNTETADPEVLRRFEEALDDLRRGGAEVVDVTIAELDTISGSLFCGRFELDLEAYLASLGPDAPVRTLEEVIATGDYHPTVAGRLRGFTGFEGVESDESCREAERNVPRLRAGVRKVLAEQALDALVYPTWSNPPRLIGDLNSPHGNNSPQISPPTGFPALTVPMGYVGGGLPVGLQILGDAWSEPTLIEIAYAYEQATGHRRPPPTTP